MGVEAEELAALHREDGGHCLFHKVRPPTEDTDTEAKGCLVKVR